MYQIRCVHTRCGFDAHQLDADWNVNQNSTNHVYTCYSTFVEMTISYVYLCWHVKYQLRKTWRSHPRLSRSFAVLSYVTQLLVTPSNRLKLMSHIYITIYFNCYVIAQQLPRPYLCRSNEPLPKYCLIFAYPCSPRFHSPSHHFYRQVGRSNNDYVRLVSFCDPIDAFRSYAIVS